MKKTRTIILGGGYAGLQVALHLNAHLTDVILIDPNTHHELAPESPHRISNPKLETNIPFTNLLKKKDTQIINQAVSEVNYQTKSVTLANGEQVEFDYLVIALGCNTNYFGIKGLEEHSLPFVNTADADKVLQTIESNIELATSLSKESVEYKQALSFVVGGGGLTGVEVAAELLYVLPTLFEKHNLDYTDCQIHLVEGMEVLLPAMRGTDRNLSQKVTDFFQNRQDITIHLNSFITEASQNSITLKDGTNIQANTILWTGGIRGNKFVDKPYINKSGESANWPLARGFRIKVDENYQVTDTENTFVVGDISCAIDPLTEHPYIQNGQIAYQQGKIVSKVINTMLEGGNLQSIDKKISNKGVLVSLGPSIGAGIMYSPLRVELPVNPISRFIKKLIETRYKVLDIR